MSGVSSQDASSQSMRRRTDPHWSARSGAGTPLFNPFRPFYLREVMRVDARSSLPIALRAKRCVAHPDSWEQIAPNRV